MPTEIDADLLNHRISSGCVGAALGVYQALCTDRPAEVLVARVIHLHEQVRSAISMLSALEDELPATTGWHRSACHALLAYPVAVLERLLALGDPDAHRPVDDIDVVDAVAIGHHRDQLVRLANASGGRHLFGDPPNLVALIAAADRECRELASRASQSAVTNDGDLLCPLRPLGYDRRTACYSVEVARPDGTWTRCEVSKPQHVALEAMATACLEGIHRLSNADLDERTRATGSQKHVQAAAKAHPEIAQVLLPRGSRGRRTTRPNGFRAAKIDRPI